MAASVEFPDVQVRMNPETGLVNLPTWLWAEGYRGQDLVASRSWSPPYEPTTIEVRYSLRRYLWNFGDGGQVATRSLGQPYPRESDITNAYGWSSRTEPAFQPNRVRIARNSQLSAAGRSTSPCCTTAGRFPGVRWLSAGFSGLGSESGISVHPFPLPA